MSTLPFYVSDDATMIGSFILSDWSYNPTKLKKPDIYYTPDTDVDTYNFAQGGIQCQIYADEMYKVPRGIGFDGYEVVRNIHIHLKCMNYQFILMASDEIERILNTHRINPGNNWNLLFDVADSPVWPSRKFIYREITVSLKCYWKPAVRPS